MVTLPHLSSNLAVVVLGAVVVVLAFAVVALWRRTNELERRLKHAGREPLYRGDRF